MDVKRMLTGLLGAPIIIAILILSNTFVFDIIIAIVAFIMMDEYCRCFPKEKAKPIKWISYLSCIFIAFIHIIPEENISQIIMYGAVTLVTILFLYVVITKIKTNIIDISVTAFGIIYIVFFISFIPILRETENGRFLVWYIFFAAWATDVFAYFVGKYIGKHKFSEISPKKTIEGCIGGIIGSILFCVVYTFIINKFFDMNISYFVIAGLSIILSIISQLGDFSASTIKRYTGVKDFSNLLPGHGGMLDRCDSVLFIAPFAYILLTLLV